VFNAILDGQDAIMLSAETASGDYPIEAVQMMTRIVLETEAGNIQHANHSVSTSRKNMAVSHAARALSEEASVKAIVVFTRSGTSARLISKDRPTPTHPGLLHPPSESIASLPFGGASGLTASKCRVQLRH